MVVTMFNPLKTHQRTCRAGDFSTILTRKIRTKLVACVPSKTCCKLPKIWPENTFCSNRYLYLPNPTSKPHKVQIFADGLKGHVLSTTYYSVLLSFAFVANIVSRTKINSNIAWFNPNFYFDIICAQGNTLWHKILILVLIDFTNT